MFKNLIKKLGLKKGKAALSKRGAVGQKVKKSVKKTAEPKIESQELVGGAPKEKREIRLGAAYRILLRPLITEKSADLSAQRKYFFEVGLNANKIEIKKAIQDVYGIRPQSVNILKVGGKTVRYGRTAGRRKSWKKAIVTLKPGEKIEVYEGV